MNYTLAARTQAPSQSQAPSRTHKTSFRQIPAADAVPDLAWPIASAAELTRVGSDALALPFDIARAQYARAVQVGLIERSLLNSARFGQALNALEGLVLGPLSRRY